MTVYPSVSILSQASRFSLPHRIPPSSLRTCHTNCGARQSGDACDARTTGSSLAACQSAVVWRPPTARAARRRWRAGRGCSCDARRPRWCRARRGDCGPRRCRPGRLLDRVLHQVELRGRLRDGGEERHLGERQVLERLAEVRLGGRLHAVAVVAVEVLVEVRRHDLPLAVVARVGLREADRLDDLLDLALVDRCPSNAACGRSRARTSCWVMVEPPRSLPLMRVEGGGGEPERVEARVLPEGLVLDRVVASMSSGGICSNVTTSRRSSPSRASSTCRRCGHRTFDCWVKVEVVEDLLGLVQALRRSTQYAPTAPANRDDSRR